MGGGVCALRWQIRGSLERQGWPGWLGSQPFDMGWAFPQPLCSPASTRGPAGPALPLEAAMPPFLCLRIAVRRITRMPANRSQFVSSFVSKATALPLAAATPPTDQSNASSFCACLQWAEREESTVGAGSGSALAVRCPPRVTPAPLLSPPARLYSGRPRLQRAQAAALRLRVIFRLHGSAAVGPQAPSRSCGGPLRLRPSGRRGQRRCA